MHACSIWFLFYKSEIKKSKPNPNKKNWTESKQKNGKKPQSNREKLSQTEKTEPNWFELFFFQNNRTELKPVGLNRFQFFLYKKSDLVTFFDKNRTEPKMITLVNKH
jgi:hypothetical protein